MQQATVNLFADMGVQPSTLASRRHVPRPSPRTPRRRPRLSPRPRLARAPRMATRSRSPARRRTPAAASWRALRSRPTAEAPGTQPRSAAPPRRRSTGHTAGLRTAIPRRRSRRERRTTAGTSRYRPMRSRSTSTAPARCSARPRLPVPPTRRTAATRRPSRSASSSPPISSARSPGSASTRPRPTPARTSAACGRPRARGSPRRRSRVRAPPAGRRSRSRTPSRSAPGHDVCRLLLRAQRALLGDRGLLLPAAVTAADGWRQRRQSAAARAPQLERHRQRRLPVLRRVSTFPTNTFGAGNYWVDVIFSPAARRAR